MSSLDNLKGLHPQHNAFNLSHSHMTTMEMGTLCPIGWLECIPGDTFDLDMEALIRCQPLVAPILNNLKCRIDAFFVPTRLLWKDWQSFITNIVQDSIPVRQFDGTPPVWAETDAGSMAEIDMSVNGLWDYFGLPPADTFNNNASKEYRPVDFLRRAYYLIWNEWYRDQNIQEPIDFVNDNTQKLMRRAWKKDYFTSGFISRQKGDPVSIPLTSTAGANFNFRMTNMFTNESNSVTLGNYANLTGGAGAVGFSSSRPADDTNAQNNAFTAINNWFNQSNTIDWSKVTTFDVSDMRDMFAIQRFMEHNMMFGTRYIEFLQSWFGCSPSDRTLQRPDLIGTLEFDIKISEVVQTAGNGETPQGNQTGHGLGVSGSSLGNYKAEEFGYIIILANIQPPSVYTQTMPRSLFRKTRFDQVIPAFYNLSYQAVLQREIYAQGTQEDEKVFNYQGRYDELRSMQSYISGELRGNLFYYLNARKFKKAPAYNGEFIECNPSKEIFAVQDEPPFICWFYFDFKALRPLPEISEPGRIDHIYGE